MRTEINYKKEGFSQIFPVLYITNDKEKAWVFGFGNKNISFVSGENDDYKEHKELIERQKNNADILSNPNSKLFGVSDTKKQIIMAVLLIGVIGIAYHFIKRRR